MTKEKTDSGKGALYIIATPIGNLEDITLRALRILKECDAVFAEDTRRTRVLLDKYEIHKRLESYHIFNEHGKTPELLRRVQNGEKIALVSDAGTPCIADPGFLLIREAVNSGIEPEIIPGVSSLTFAIAASALPSDKFTFYGFLPVKSGRRSAMLERIASEDKTCIIFESPYRIAKLLKEVNDVLGPDTPVALVREATKLHEEILRGKVSEILNDTALRNWKGECVLVIHKSSASDSDEDFPEADSSSFV